MKIVKRRSSSQNTVCAKFHDILDEDQKQKKIFVAKSAKKRFLPTIIGLITNILGIAGPELHFSDTDPVTFFGAQFLLGGGFFSLGGAQAVIRGARTRNAS